MPGWLKVGAIIIFVLTLSHNLRALNLDEALSLAQENCPLLKQQSRWQERAHYLYKSTIDAYLPTLATNLSYQRTFESSLYSPGRLWDNQYQWDLSLKYRLFDGGYRFSRRKQALYDWKQSQSDVEKIKNELMAEVKKAFFEVLARREILKVRQQACQIAQRNYRLALARKQAGIAKISDVTQAQVRYTNARMDVISARKELEQAMADLNSLIGWPLNKEAKVEGRLYTAWLKISLPAIEDLALKRRPEVKKQLLEVKKAEAAIKEFRSAYFPKVDLEVDYNRFDSQPDLSQREAALLVALHYDLFDGLGRYYKVKAQKKVLESVQAALEETKRRTRLEVFKAYKEMQKAYANFKIAQELVKEAQVNYEQVYGEYKVGKGDVIALINAEMNLAQSKISLVNQKLNYTLSIVNLEKTIFVKSLMGSIK